jgi:hypothetical protein
MGRDEGSLCQSKPGPQVFMHIFDARPSRACWIRGNSYMYRAWVWIEVRSGGVLGFGCVDKDGVALS